MARSWLGDHSANQEALEVCLRGSWMLCTPSLTGATMHVVNGQLTVFGGNDGKGTVEVFNGESWNVVATLQNSYYGHASFVFPSFT